jgi:hypothetical protein
MEETKNRNNDLPFIQHRVLIKIKNSNRLLLLLLFWQVNSDRFSNKETDGTMAKCVWGRFIEVVEPVQSLYHAIGMICSCPHHCFKSLNSGSYHHRCVCVCVCVCERERERESFFIECGHRSRIQEVKNKQRQRKQISWNACRTQYGIGYDYLVLPR